MSIIPPFYPIIYIRGYAARMSEIDDTVATPYMGFNLGSTKIRQNSKGDIHRFIFESPLIRLMKDHDYIDTYQNGDYVRADPENDKLVSAQGIWIFRYYERVSKSLGDDERMTIPEFAEDLREFILNVRDQVCGIPAVGMKPEIKQQIIQDRKDFRVYLIAHSMGGLIARSYLQNLCVRGVRKANGTVDQVRNKKLELTPLAAGKKEVPASVHLVDKVFTYGTPHNGVEFLGVNMPNFGSFDGLHARNFNRDVMAKYLNIKRTKKGDNSVNTLEGAFPADRFFCFMGSNYNDYEAFGGLSRKGTGPMSDGLVMMKHAAVQDAPRAVAHRAHSGDYGIVNSEEGYQNLRRFLFGSRRVDFILRIEEVLAPEAVQKLMDDKKKVVSASYNIETTAQVRGADYYLHERRSSQASAIRRDQKTITQKNKPIYLFTGYLLEGARTHTDRISRNGKWHKDDKGELAFVLQVGVEIPVFEVDNRFWFDEHFKGGYLLNESITFHINRNRAFPKLEYGIVSQAGYGEVNVSPVIKNGANGSFSLDIPLGFTKDDPNPIRPSMRAILQVKVSGWN